MKKLLFTILTLCMSLASFAALPIIDPNLAAEMKRMDDNEKIKINILMTEQANAMALLREAEFYSNKQEQRQFVIETLKQQAEASQAELLKNLEEMERNSMVNDIQPFWLVNCVSCMANKAAINDLAQRRDILTIYHCEEAQWVFEEETTPAPRALDREITQNLLQVNAPQVWELGYTGESVLVAIIDTGVSLTHSDLQGRFWDGGDAYPNHGYDFANHDNDPSDENGHGTHVAGTICGTGVSGSQTGVAPDAKIMVLKVFGADQQTDETILVEAMQFAIEHDADLLNMSLGWPDASAPIKLLYRQACENTLAAGIVAAVCAGNIRHMQDWVPIPRNIYSPGDCPPPYLHEDQMVNVGGTSCVISVGAVDYNDSITYFSSVGPSTWADVAPYNDYPYTLGSTTEIGLIRPDVCAPGLNIKSLNYNDDNGYCYMEGTSMATPCVSGAIALMLSKNHELTPAQIDEILERTAVKLTEHKSNDYGSGRLDALAAVNAVDPDMVSETLGKISVYPNPSMGDFTIVGDGISLVSVFSVEGKLLKTIKVDGAECHIDGLPNGVFVLKIDTDQGVIVNKIVKM